MSWETARVWVVNVDMAEESLLQQQANEWAHVARSCDEKLVELVDIKSRLENAWSGHTAEKQIAEIERLSVVVRQGADSARENSRSWQRVSDTAAWARHEINQILQEWQAHRNHASQEHQRSVQETNDQLRQWINTPIQLWRPKEPDYSSIWHPYAQRIDEIARTAAQTYDEVRSQLRHAPNYEPPPSIGIEPSIAPIVVPKPENQPGDAARQQLTAEIPDQENQKASPARPKLGVPAVLGRSRRRSR